MSAYAAAHLLFSAAALARNILLFGLSGMPSAYLPGDQLTVR